MNTYCKARVRSGILGVAVAAFAFLAFGSCATAPAAAGGEGAPARKVTVWKVSSIERLRPDGTVSGRVTFGYAPNGDLLSEDTFGPGGAILSRKTYVRAADGSEEVVSLGANGEVLGKASRKYAGGKLVGETLFGPAGAVLSTEEYALDGRGRRVSRVVVPSSGFGTSSEYDYEGDDLVRTVVRDSSGKILRRFETTVENGLPVREDEYDGAGNRVSAVLRHYAGGSLLREDRLTASLSVSSAYEYDRDTHGNAVETRYLDRNGRLLETTRTAWVSFGETAASAARDAR